MPLTFGLTEGQIKRRKLAERRQKAKNEEIINSLLQEIKDCNKNDGWLSVPTHFIQEHYNVKDGFRIVYITNAIRSNPNIINKIIKQDSKQGCHGYKYVDKEYKNSLLFKALTYKDIKEDDITLLNNTYHTADNININNILTCYGYLKRAKANEEWVKIDMMIFITRKMLPIDDFLAALNSLYEHKLLTYKLIEKETYFRLTTPNTFSEINTNNNVKISSQNDIVLQQDLTAINNKNTNDTVQNNIDFNVKEDKNSPTDNIDNKFNLLRQHIFNFFDEYKKEIQSSLEKEQEETNRSYNALIKLQTENERLSKQINDLKTKYNEQQKRLEATREYNYKFTKNTFMLLEDMIGQSINLISDFAKNPRYVFSDQNRVNRFKGNLVQTISDTVSEIKRFNPDSKYPEQEIK